MNNIYSIVTKLCHGINMLSKNFVLLHVTNDVTKQGKLV